MSTTDTKEQKRAKFERVFASMRDELVEHLKSEGMPCEAVDWYQRVRRPSSSSRRVRIVMRPV